MKKILTIAILALVATVSYGQTTFVKYFVGENYEAYKGLLTKVDISGDQSPSYRFWANIPENSVDREKILYPEDKYSYTTDITKLKDKVFRIDSIFEFKSYTSEKLFKLVGVNNNETIYYTYNPSNEYYHLLLTEPVKISESVLKRNIEKTVDDFTREVKYNSPYNNQVGVIYKYINKGKITYYLSLEIGSSGIYRGNGVTVLFTDGTKWSRPTEKVDIVYRSGFVNSVFIALSPNDLQIFKTKIVKKYRLYIHDQDVDLPEADMFRTYTSLITKM